MQKYEAEKKELINWITRKLNFSFQRYPKKIKREAIIWEIIFTILTAEKSFIRIRI